MQHLVQRFVEQSLSRRGLMQKLSGLGIGMAAAQKIVEPLQASEDAGKGLPVPGSTTITGTGGELIMAQAKAAGSEYLFTNPGSFEVGLFDAQPSSGIPLIMGLHEGIVISMADGYHRVSLKPSFVNIHVIAGTAQAIGQLYNASRDGSALVVTAGMLDNEIWSDEGMLAPRPGFDQKEVTRQFTKICWECREPQSLPLMLRRAYKVAATEPGGPVYLAMVNYALEAKNIKAQILPGERFLLRSRVRPEAAAVEQAAKWLITAKQPLLVAGDEVWKSGAQAELVAFAEKFGLPVMSGPGGYRSFPSRHQMHLGNFNMGSEYMKGGVDLVIMVGARDFGGRTVPNTPEAPDAHIVRIGLDTAHMGRNYPTDLALAGDVKESLKDLRSALEGMLAKQRLADFGKPRAALVRGLLAKMRSSYEAQTRKNFGKPEMHPDELTHVMAKTIDKNAIIASETHSAMAHYETFPFGVREDEQMFAGYTGNSLGWGIGGATGAKLAAPGRLVVCSIGDGAVMYSASGFWTQARYGIPVLTVIWNNHNYQAVRLGFHRYGGKMAATGQFAGMYLGDPEINFVKLAESQGVKGERVTTASELEAALKRGIQQTRDGNPYVIDAVISRIGGGAESTWHEGFKLSQRMKGRRA
ncbi:MAG: thiamine pyrophosphate-binding protein [Bryobacteraceae bacterium]